MATRIAKPVLVPVTDNYLDRVQRALAGPLVNIINTPTLDTQVVSASVMATTASQTLTFGHSLGRTPTGLSLVSVPGLITGWGQHVLTATTASINITQSAAVSGSATAVVF